MTTTGWRAMAKWITWAGFLKAALLVAFGAGMTYQIMLARIGNLEAALAESKADRAEIRRELLKHEHEGAEALERVAELSRETVLRNDADHSTIKQTQSEMTATLAEIKADIRWLKEKGSKIAMSGD